MQRTRASTGRSDTGGRVESNGEFAATDSGASLRCPGPGFLSEVQLGLVHDPPSTRAATAETERVSQTRHETGFRKRLQTGQPRAEIPRPVNDLGDPIRRRIEHILVRDSAGCHGQRGYPARSTERASRLDDVAPDLAQHPAYVAEPIPGPAEQLRGASPTPIAGSFAIRVAANSNSPTWSAMVPSVSRRTWRRTVAAVSAGVVIASPTGSSDCRICSTSVLI